MLSQVFVCSGEVGISGARSHPGPWFHVLSGKGVEYAAGKVSGGGVV